VYSYYVSFKWYYVLVIRKGVSDDGIVKRVHERGRLEGGWPREGPSAILSAEQT